MMVLANRKLAWTWAVVLAVGKLSVLVKSNMLLLIQCKDY